jgi:mono/diheme cytochrome c family protein
MRKINNLILFFMVILLFGSCTWHNEEEYFADTTDSCSTANMSFQTDIQPLLQTSCVSCHNSGFASGGINLDGYDNIKSIAQSGLLSKVINHESGVVAMPMNADKLTECTIKKIDAWIEQGAKNN